VTNDSDREIIDSGYVDVILAYGEACGSTLRAQKMSVRLLLVGVQEANVSFKRTGGKCCHNNSQYQRYAGKNARIISLAPSLLYRQ
jgi:hypothetical protein